MCWSELRRLSGDVAQSIQRETATRGAERDMIMGRDIAHTEFRKDRIHPHAFAMRLYRGDLVVGRGNDSDLKRRSWSALFCWGRGPGHAHPLGLFGLDHKGELCPGGRRRSRVHDEILESEQASPIA